MSRTTITQAPPSVTRCEPNLMPFHIEYNGAAPISTFLHVQDAKKNIGAPEEPTNDGSQRTVVDSEVSSETVTASSSSSSTLVSTTSTELDSQSSTNQQLSDLPNRYISAFRGRTIHGLAVDVPEGFMGVVFRSEGADSGEHQQRLGVKEEEKLKAAAAAAAKRKMKGKKGNEKATATDVDTPGRGTRSSRRKAVEDEDMDEDEEEDVALLGEEEEYLGGGGTPINLIPTSNFSSFMLWHPDIPVDTGKDEYFGTLSEWMKISQVMHRVEDGS